MGKKLILLSLFISISALADWTPISNCELAPSSEVPESGPVISSINYDSSHWEKVSVPGTIIGTSRKFLNSDSFKDLNFRKIPGTTYGIGEDFSKIPMPDDSPFNQTWWYRCQFKTKNHKFISLHIDGVNYFAQVFHNSKQIGFNLEGALRNYGFTIANSDDTNVIAIGVKPQKVESLGFTWIDWAPMPADKNMGVWRGIHFKEHGSVSIIDYKIKSKIEGEEVSKVEVIVKLQNHDELPFDGTLKIQLGNLIQELPVLMHEKTKSEFVFKWDKPQLKPWWPYNLGDPNLYGLSILVQTKNKLSDELYSKVGLRDVQSFLDSNGHRQFVVNGKLFFVRGGGWAPDLFLRNVDDKLPLQFELIKKSGLNTLRLEGKLESESFFQAADKSGIMVIFGPTCCNYWEMWDRWGENDFNVAKASIGDSSQRIKNHPSILSFFLASDKKIPHWVEKAYLQELENQIWDVPVVAGAAGHNTELGHTGVKMRGPYDYVPPRYWSEDKKYGGAFGFNTETGFGAAIPNTSSLVRFISPKNWKFQNEVWRFHCGSVDFNQMDKFAQALSKRFGLFDDFNRLLNFANLLVYEGHRAMFEAYNLEKFRNATGVIQWLVNSPWPNLGWHLYDYYLTPTAAFYGAKKANENLHIQYNPHEHKIYGVINGENQIKQIRASYQLFDKKLKVIKEASRNIEINFTDRLELFDLPDLAGKHQVYYLRLAIALPNGSEVSSNDYILSSDKEVLDYPRTTYIHTPVKVEADLSQVRDFPRSKVTFRVLNSKRDSNNTVILVKNEALVPAIQISLDLADAPQGVFWSENYFSLLPGASKLVEVNVKGELKVQISGINL